MRTLILGSVGLLLVMSASSRVILSQGAAATTVTYVTAEDIQAVVKYQGGGGDRMIKHVDMGGYNVGIAVLRRAATKKAGGPLTGINHTKVTEVYYIVSGAGTMITGTDMTDIRPLAADTELVKQIVGPSNNGTFRTVAQTRDVKTGDMIIIPPGVYHGFSNVSDHIEYVTVRPDPDQVLPAGYVNPALK
jgi:mannose-6-phosphate isomerase-like protein (cupin superfamily)